MKVLRTAVAAVAASILSYPAYAAESGIRVSYQESLKRLTVPQAVEADAPTRALKFDAFGREFDFRLQPNRSLLERIPSQALASGVGVFRGTIAGTPNSWARLVVANGVPRGMFYDGSELYGVEVTTDASGNETPYVFRLADLEIAPGTLECAHSGMAKDANQLFDAVTREAGMRMAQGFGAVSKVEVGMVADFEFTNAKGAATNTEIVTRMNVVDGIFSSQLGVQITVTRIDSFSSSNDPFSDETDSRLLIDEVADYRFNSPGQYVNGLTHLFTGRDLNGTTVGTAFSSALCSRRFGAGLSQGTHSMTVDSLIAAHEIGHNFGAPHDGEMGSACMSTPPDFLMAPAINGSDQFSACSITQMQYILASASCLTPLSGTDIAAVAGPQPSNVSIDDNVLVTFDVNNVGTESAAGASLDVTVPTTVNVNSVTSTAGSCTTGAGGVTCSLGTIIGGTGVTVTLDTTALSDGSATFTATAAATVDANPNNNDALVSFNIGAVVDLAVQPAAAAQVDVNQSITIRPTLENRSSLTATGVVLTIIPDAGLRIDSVSWTPGSCTVGDDGVATCQAANLAGLTSAGIDVQLTGMIEGAQMYAISVSSNDTDRDMSNNDLSGQVTVGAAAPASPAEENSGGGSFGGLTLLLLAVAALRRRYRG